MHKISGSGHKPGTPHTDPDYAPTVEVFDHLPYADIYRGVAQLNPEVLTAGRQAWHASSAGLAEAVQQAHAEIRGAIADGWRGTAAQLAGEAVQAFEELGQHLSDVMGVVGERLGQANDAAETLRSAVSQPVSSGEPDLEGALLDPKRAAANVTVQKAAESLRQDVVRVMNSVYAGIFLPTGSNVPAFHDGGMYPNPPTGADNSGETAPGGGSADALPSGVRGDDRVRPTDQVTAAAPRAEAARQGGETAQSGTGGDDSGSTAPAAVTAPAATDAAVPAAPAPAAAPSVPPHVAPAAANIVAPHNDRVVPEPTVEQPRPGAAAPSAIPGVAATVPGVATAAQSAGGQGTATHAAAADGQRKKDEHAPQADPSDTVTGMGAGVVGGLAGGAFAATDTTRSAARKPVPPQQFEDDEDEDYYPDFDEPTFLEPADPGSELVGQFAPTTPPVLGEWVEDA
ncbi:WXG100 family type VII secretion target [Nocardia terpenica]|uniref:PPE domain-containing protein n=1 Tax=Nocardia terpenica TaxID=455432 RepID=A0A291RSS2_9NOCA|nr:hypothetical protein [Nocardia terpenica]ATL70284.1 hypothetical protein CRH09_33000 [Nocardia terpenica]